MAGPLETKEQICDYMKCSWERIEMLMAKYGFPVRKIGGIWTSHTISIDEWQQKVVIQNIDEK